MKTLNHFKKVKVKELLEIYSNKIQLTAEANNRVTLAERCLKYVVIASRLSDEHANQFASQEAGGGVEDQQRHHANSEPARRL